MMVVALKKVFLLSAAAVFAGQALRMDNLSSSSSKTVASDNEFETLQNDFTQEVMKFKANLCDIFDQMSPDIIFEQVLETENIRMRADQAKSKRTQLISMINKIKHGSSSSVTSTTRRSTPFVATPPPAPAPASSSSNSADGAKAAPKKPPKRNKKEMKKLIVAELRNKDSPAMSCFDDLPTATQSQINSMNLDGVQLEDLFQNAKKDVCNSCKKLLSKDRKLQKTTKCGGCGTYFCPSCLGKHFSTTEGNKCFKQIHGDEIKQNIGKSTGGGEFSKIDKI